MLLFSRLKGRGKAARDSVEHRMNWSDITGKQKPDQKNELRGGHLWAWRCAGCIWGKKGPFKTLNEVPRKPPLIKIQRPYFVRIKIRPRPRKKI